MIKNKTHSDKIYNSLALVFSSATLILLAVFLIYSKAQGARYMLEPVFLTVYFLFFGVGLFFALKQIIRNLHLEALISIMLTMVSVICLIVFVI